MVGPDAARGLPARDGGAREHAGLAARCASAPTREPASLAQGLEGWSRHGARSRRPWSTCCASRGSCRSARERRPRLHPGRARAYDGLHPRRTEVQLHRGCRPGLASGAAARAPRPYGVLDVRVSTRRLQDWARLERRRAYLLAFLSALLVALVVAVLTARWVGRPLASLGTAMAAAHGGATGAPAAPEIGPPEFRELTRRYNRMREALAARERESAARAMLLTLEERARGLDRLALMHETAAMFAHEIGTPLNTVSGHLQLLRDDFEAQQDLRGMERVRLCWRRWTGSPGSCARARPRGLADAAGTAGGPQRDRACA